MSLFDPDPSGAPEPPGPPLSRDRQRTQRRAAMLAAGTHPATRLPLLEPQEGRTCGNCSHHFVRTFWPRRFHKCDATEAGRSAASDLRVSWPACTLWQQGVEP